MENNRETYGGPDLTNIEANIEAERAKKRERRKNLRGQYRKLKYPENVGIGKELDELEGNIRRTELTNGGVVDTRPMYGPGGREFEMYIDTPQIRELKEKIKRGEDLTEEELDWQAEVFPGIPLRLFDVDDLGAPQGAERIHSLAVQMINEGLPLPEVFKKIREESAYFEERSSYYK